MARKSHKDAASQPDRLDADLSALLGSDSPESVVIGVTDETRALLDAVFGSDPLGMDSFAGLNFFTFG
jgi:hypothetical protein